MQRNGQATRRKILEIPLGEIIAIALFLRLGFAALARLNQTHAHKLARCAPEVRRSIGGRSARKHRRPATIIIELDTAVTSMTAIV